LSRVFAVVITGPPGAGKTTVLTALADALSDDDIAHAAIEVEMLVWTHPALTDEQWTRQVRVACKLYREAVHRLLLVAQTLENEADVNELLDAVGAEEVLCVRLEARPASLAKRIIEREPAGWSGLSGLVEHAQVLAATMPGLPGFDLVLSTEGERAEDVAARIRAARRDRLS
jgi:ATPase subunit of ABC transporter with duplicated ATPase domains